MGWIGHELWCHRNQVGVKQWYNPGATGSQLVWRQRSKSVFHFEEWKPGPSKGWAPWPPVEQPSRMRRKCCYSQCAGWGQYVAFFVQSPTHLSHNNHFVTLSNKVWEVYFSKELCPFVFIVLTMFLHAFEYVTWLPKKCNSKYIRRIFFLCMSVKISNFFNDQDIFIKIFQDVY